MLVYSSQVPYNVFMVNKEQSDQDTQQCYLNTELSSVREEYYDKPFSDYRDECVCFNGEQR